MFPQCLEVSVSNSQIKSYLQFYQFATRGCWCEEMNGGSLQTGNLKWTKMKCTFFDLEDYYEGVTRTHITGLQQAS